MPDTDPGFRIEWRGYVKDSKCREKMGGLGRHESYMMWSRDHLSERRRVNRLLGSRPPRERTIERKILTCVLSREDSKSQGEEARVLK